MFLGPIYELQKNKLPVRPKEVRSEDGYGKKIRAIRPQHYLSRFTPLEVYSFYLAVARVAPV